MDASLVSKALSTSLALCVLHYRSFTVKITVRFCVVYPSTQETSKSLVRAGLVIDIKRASWLRVSVAIVNVQIHLKAYNASMLVTPLIPYVIISL